MSASIPICSYARISRTSSHRRINTAATTIVAVVRESNKPHPNRLSIVPRTRAGNGRIRTRAPRESPRLARRAHRLQRTLRQGSPGTTGLLDDVEQINQSSVEQAKGISQVARGVAEMERVTQTSAASSEEAAAAAEELTAQSQAVRAVVHGLEVLVAGTSRL